MSEGKTSSATCYPGLKSLLLIFLISVFAVSLMAQAGGGFRLYRNQTVMGFGLGASQYTTKWKLKSDQSADPELSMPPVHVHRLLSFSIFTEKRSLINFGKYDMDWKNEVDIKLIGKTEQTYLADSLSALVSQGEIGGESLFSSGGLGINFGSLFRFARPMRMSHKSIFAPFVGTGVEFFYLNSTGMGEDLDSDFSQSVYANRSYKIGWSEFGFSLPLEAGMHFLFNSFSISPEVRYRPIGLALSNLKGSPEIEYQGLSSFSVQLSFGFTRLNMNRI